MELTKTLQALYDSEINVTITTLWDGGYDLSLTSSMETPTREDIENVYTVAEIAPMLHQMALVKYPNSKYAKEAAIAHAEQLIG